MGETFLDCFLLGQKPSLAWPGTYNLVTTLAETDFSSFSLKTNNPPPKKPKGGGATTTPPLFFETNSKDQSGLELGLQA